MVSLSHWLFSVRSTAVRVRRCGRSLRVGDVCECNRQDMLVGSVHDLEIPVVPSLASLITLSNTLARSFGSLAHVWMRHWRAGFLMTARTEAI